MDVFTTATLHSRLLNMSSRSMSVVYALSVSQTLVTSTMMKKSDKHTKTSSWFTNTKVYLLLYFLVVIKKRETAY